eukprot:scaffold153703_cov39-Attheya_sp.AAC.1
MPTVADNAACPSLAAKVNEPCTNVNGWEEFLMAVEQNTTDSEVVFCPFDVTKELDDRNAEIIYSTSVICPTGQCIINGPGKHFEVNAASTLQGFIFRGATTSSVRFLSDPGQSKICDWGIRGGGIRIGSNANITVENSVFTNNTASQGGAIYITPRGFLTITNSDFQYNQAEGGAIYVSDEDSKLVANRNVFQNNNVESRGDGTEPRGPAIYLEGSLDDYSTDYGNSGTDNGNCNGIYVDDNPCEPFLRFDSLNMPRTTTSGSPTTSPTTTSGSPNRGSFSIVNSIIGFSVLSFFFAGPHLDL